jgi:hypothetical protein
MTKGVVRVDMIRFMSGVESLERDISKVQFLTT